MLYYNLTDSGEITGFTPHKWVADIKGYHYTTDENIVMQHDGSGWVFESQYDDSLEPKTFWPTTADVIAENTADIRERVDAVNDAMIALMFGGDEDAED